MMCEVSVIFANFLANFLFQISSTILISSTNGFPAWEQADQGSGGLLPWSYVKVVEMWPLETWFSCGFSYARLWSYLMILKVFSNQNYSIIFIPQFVSERPSAILQLILASDTTFILLL